MQMKQEVANTSSYSLMFVYTYSAFFLYPGIKLKVVKTH